MTKRIIIEGAPVDKLGRRKRQKIFNVDRDWFHQKYAVELVPTWRLAQEIGCVENHISAIADMLGIPRRGRLPKSRKPSNMLDIDVDLAVKMYLDDKMSCEAIGEFFGCTSKPIYARLREAGVRIRHHNETKRGRSAKNKINLDHALVVSMYLQPYASGKTVADHFVVSRQVIDRILNEEGVPKKPISEARDMRKEKHPLWRADLTPKEREQRRDMVKQKEWSQKVYERDNYTCQKCGDSKGGNLNAHHIIPHSRDRSKAWDLDNGITLCKTCHYEFHNRYSYTRCTEADLAEYLADVKATSKPSK